MTGTVSSRGKEQLKFLLHSLRVIFIWKQSAKHNINFSWPQLYDTGTINSTLYIMLFLFTRLISFYFILGVIQFFSEVSCISDHIPKSKVQAQIFYFCHTILLNTFAHKNQKPLRPNWTVDKKCIMTHFLSPQELQDFHFPSAVHEILLFWQKVPNYLFVSRTFNHILLPSSVDGAAQYNYSIIFTYSDTRYFSS